MSEAEHNQPASDYTRKPLGFMLAWGIPILVVLSMNFLRNVIPVEIVIGILAAAFAWMGIACLINARRCGRRHCYLSGPVLLAGSIGIVLVGYGIIRLGPDGLNHVIAITLIAVALTFIPELIWGRYVRGQRN